MILQDEIKKLIFEPEENEKNLGVYLEREGTSEIINGEGCKKERRILSGYLGYIPINEDDWAPYIKRIVDGLYQLMGHFKDTLYIDPRTSNRKTLDSKLIEKIVRKIEEEGFLFHRVEVIKLFEVHTE